MTLNDLLDWSNGVKERKCNGEEVGPLEYDAAEAIFKYALSEARKQKPFQLYAMLLKHKELK